MESCTCKTWPKRKDLEKEGEEVRQQTPPVQRIMGISLFVFCIALLAPIIS